MKKILATILSLTLFSHTLYGKNNLVREPYFFIYESNSNKSIQVSLKDTETLSFKFCEDQEDLVCTIHLLPLEWYIGRVESQLKMYDKIGTKIISTGSILSVGIFISITTWFLFSRTSKVRKYAYAGLSSLGLSTLLGYSFFSIYRSKWQAEDILLSLEEKLSIINDGVNDGPLFIEVNEIDNLWKLFLLMMTKGDDKIRFINGVDDLWNLVTQN